MFLLVWNITSRHRFPNRGSIKMANNSPRCPGQRGQEAWNADLRGRAPVAGRATAGMEVLKSYIWKDGLMAPLIHVCTAAEEDRAEFMLDASRPHPASHACNQLICTLVLIRSCCARSTFLRVIWYVKYPVSLRVAIGLLLVSLAGGYRHHQMISLRFISWWKRE